MTYRLARRQLERFEEDGFLGPLDAFMSGAECDAIAELFKVVVEQKCVNPLYQRYSTRDWHLLHPLVGKLFSHPAVVEPVQQILGEDVQLWRSKIFLKASGERELGWHQEWGAFNGEEIGNDVPGLKPAPQTREPWNVTVWFALTDITSDMGPLRFIRGSHRTRFPIAMVEMPKSGFFHEPFLDIHSVDDVILRAKQNRLVLDVDTSEFFTDVNREKLTLEDAKGVVIGRLAHMKAAVTVPFDYEPSDLVTLSEMKKGQFVLFYERTMHGSTSNTSNTDRVAVNCRITRGDTLVYPGRISGDFVDGSNLDVHHHRCIALGGRHFHPDNEYGELPAQDLTGIKV